jgi:hypothetical protein
MADFQRFEGNCSFHKFPVVLKLSVTTELGRLTQAAVAAHSSQICGELKKLVSGLLRVIATDRHLWT